MPQRKFDFPLNLWVPPEIEPQHPDIIVPLGYGLAKGPDSYRLAQATRDSLLIAMGWAIKFPEALFVFGNSAHSFPGSEEFEYREKMKLVEEFYPSQNRERFLSAGPITNTVTEARAIRDEMLDAEILHPREILLITDPFHRAPDIWRKIFPDVRISLQYTIVPAYQKDHIFPGQQNRQQWLKANMLRKAAVTFMGLDWVAKHGVHKAK